MTLLKAVKDVLPLLFLGMARLYITRLTGYHVSLLEYGLHWNFFFTLAVVKVTNFHSHPIKCNKMQEMIYLTSN